MEQLDRAMRRADSFREVSFAVQYQTEETPWWQYYSSFTPNPMQAKEMYRRLLENKKCTKARVIQREDIRVEILPEELDHAEPCSRTQCRGLPMPNEDGRIVGRNR